MSGPIDFTILLAPALLAALDAFGSTQQMAFDTRVQALEQAPRRPRPKPRPRVASDDGPRPAVVDVPAESAVEEAARADAAAAEAEAAARAEAEARIAAEFADVCVALEARRDALAEDAALRAACGDRFTGWADRCARVVEAAAGSDALREARAALAEGEELVRHALEVATQVERRREVVRAIVESFHATGFFTDLAAGEDPADPARPVTIVARKGGEEVTVSLPLGDAPVQTMWEGQLGERCVDEFLDYVEEMGRRGVTCRPTRADIADRPRLRQAGQKDLPRSRSEGG